MKFIKAVYLCLLMSLTSVLSATAAEDVTAHLHMIDVREGNAILIDIGDFEILIDGGGGIGRDGFKALANYLGGTRAIDGNLEYLIISEADSTAYGNFDRWLRTGDSDDVPSIDILGKIETVLLPSTKVPDRCRRNYRRFIERLEEHGIKKIISAHEDLRATVQTMELTSIVEDQRFPGSLFIVSADGREDQPTSGRKGACGALANDGSIVIGMEINGVRTLFGGDQYTGARVYDTDPHQEYGEERTLAKIKDLDWFNDLDLLVAPRKGGITGNSFAYIRRLNPKIVLMGTHSRFPVPSRDIVEAYKVQGTRVFSTGHTPDVSRHNIVCAWSDPDDLKCNYGHIKDDKAEWQGLNKDGTTLSYGAVSKALEKGRVPNAQRRINFDAAAYALSPKGRSGMFSQGISLHGIDLSGKDLSNIDFSNVDLTNSDLRGANLTGAIFDKAILDDALLDNAQLEGSRFKNTRAHFVSASGARFHNAAIEDTDLSGAILAKAELINTRLTRVKVMGTRFDASIFEPQAFSVSGEFRAFLDNGIDSLEGLETLSYRTSPSALQKIGNYFKGSGQASKEAEIVYAIQKSRSASLDPVFQWFRWIFFELPADYGRDANRPLLLLLLGIPLFALLYLVSVFRSAGDGIFATRADGVGPSIVDIDKPIRIHHRNWRAFASALYFSFVSAFHFGWRDINVGTWAQRLSPKQFNLDSTGWVRIVSGIQSMLSFYFIALWTLMFFGNPFR